MKREDIRSANPVLILTRNCLELTKRTVESVLLQDIPTRVCFVDNGSTDGTQELIQKYRYRILYKENKGVSHGWNAGLKYLFDDAFETAEHVLVCNNDIILAPWTYSLLLSYNLPFVSGISANVLTEIQQPRLPILPTTKNPDFSCFLIRRDAWNKVGPFDERMKHYASDLDFHIRAHRAGVRLHGACVPFYHERSSTLRNSPVEERIEIESQANKDRAELKKKWGCDAWAESYDAMFREELFGVDARAQNHYSQTAPVQG